MKTIPLSQGLFAMVDDADYEAVSQFKWSAHKSGPSFCAARSIRKPDGKRTTQLMHRFLMPGVPEIDHRDGNKLNNKLENLRSVTHLQNLQGFQRKKLGTTSRFRGVYRDRKRLKWVAEVRLTGKKKFIGRFDSEVDAALARDAAALKYFGEHAHLNFPLKPYEKS